ncbi:MAG: Plasmid stabilization system [uncultured bacterium]|nr:MAG: Plasmid stabilization system [uncultured bacterium]
MYKVQIHKQASKKLTSLNAKERLRITDKIMELSYDPDSKTLDIKKLVGEEYWRLRVGKWRIVYDRDDTVRIIRIERIKSRGDIYK